MEGAIAVSLSQCIEHGESDDAVVKYTDRLVSRGNSASLVGLTVISSQG